MFETALSGAGGPLGAVLLPLCCGQLPCHQPFWGILMQFLYGAAGPADGPIWGEDYQRMQYDRLDGALASRPLWDLRGGPLFSGVSQFIQQGGRHRLAFSRVHHACLLHVLCGPVGTAPGCGPPSTTLWRGPVLGQPRSAFPWDSDGGPWGLQPRQCPGGSYSYRPGAESWQMAAGLGLSCQPSRG